MRVALFDFDGTIYKQETFKILMKHLKEHPKYGKQYSRFFRPMVIDYFLYKIKLSPENRMRERSMRHYLKAFEQMPIEEIRMFFKGVAKELSKDFNTDVLDRLAWHQSEGDLVLLVSGAYTHLLDILITEEKLPVDHVIGTEIPTKNDRVDHFHTMRHIQGERKIEEIKRVLKEKQIDWEASYAYGDSYSDLPMLKLVGNPVAVQPKKELKEIAITRHWKMI